MQKPDLNIVIEETRKWIDTPFREKGRTCGIGCDCIGLIIGVANNLGISDANFLTYGSDPSHLGDFTPILEQYLDEIEISSAVPGNIIHFKWVSQPRHFAILTPRNFGDNHFNMVHAYEPRPSHRVIEHIYDKKWQRRTISAWRYRNVELKGRN